MVPLLLIYVRKIEPWFADFCANGSKSSGIYCRMISPHGRWIGSSWLHWTHRFRVDNTSLHHIFVSTLISNFRRELLVLSKGVWKRGHNLAYIACSGWRLFHPVFLYRYVEVYAGEWKIEAIKNMVCRILLTSGLNHILTKHPSPD